jgi:hypothetical protein
MLLLLLRLLLLHLITSLFFFLRFYLVSKIKNDNASGDVCLSVNRKHEAVSLSLSLSLSQSLFVRLLFVSHQ